MMTMERLIDQLTSDLRPVPHHAVERRIAVAWAVGAVAVLLLIVLTLGFRADLDEAMARSAFWMKLLYTLSLSIGSVAAMVRLARPDALPPRGLWLLGVPVALIAGLAARELAVTPRTDWMTLLKGISWDRCSVNILLLSLPLFGAFLWAFRRFAPTRLRLAGAMAGLAAGSIAATLYGLHCPEASATFVFVWYSLGMALAAVIGGVAGPRLLRW